MNFEWSKLNKLQLGRYAEYFVKMEFTKQGFAVYSSEVDDRGIDFIIRKEPDSYYDIQVKSVRGLGYVFFPKSKFNPRKNLLAAIVVFAENEPPSIYLIPSESWRTTDALLKSYEYVGKKSPPEWGLNLCKKNLPLLSRFAFNNIVEKL
jgi:hypothetical protein